MMRHSMKLIQRATTSSIHGAPWRRSVPIASTRRRQFLPSFTARTLTTKDDSSSPSGAELHALYEEQMEELKIEREALFGFTDEDRDAWGSTSSGHKHDASFLDMVEQARREQRLQQEDSEATGDSRIAPDLSTLSQQSLNPPLADKINHQTLTHLSGDGKDVNMVDVGDKNVTKRVAVAESKVVFPPEVLEAFSTQPDEMVGPKGPIFATAKIAGIMAAKKTSELIPLCHPLPLDSVNLDIRLQDDGTAWVRCECRVTHKTGVEMEALTGCSVAALTIYDMTKAVSHNIRIEGTRLISKSGGKRRVG